MAARGRPPSARTLVDRQLGRNVVNPILPTSDGFVIPNHDGIKDYSQEQSLFWSQLEAQTGLTGDKTGSFNLTTTAEGTFGNVDITDQDTGYLVNGKLIATIVGNNFFFGDAGNTFADTGGNGNPNVGIGESALKALTGGFGNLAIGSGTLQTLTGGDGNVAIGKEALTVTNGNENIAIGNNTLAQLTTGSDNICFGNAAGLFITTGDDNIYIGALTGSFTGSTSDDLDIGGAIKGDLSTGDIDITGDLDVGADLIVNGKTIHTRTTQAVTATSTVTVNSSLHNLTATAARSLTSTPTLAAGTDGQEVTLVGTSDTNTVTLRDDRNLANTDLFLSGQVDMVLGLGDIIRLIYDSSMPGWCEVTRSVN